MTTKRQPRQGRSDGWSGAKVAYGTMDSPVRRLFVAAEERGVVAVSFLGKGPISGELAALEKRGFGPGGTREAAGGVQTAGARATDAFVPQERAAAGSREDRRAASHVAHAVRQLDDYFSGATQGFDLDLFLVGTDFQEAVWRALAHIPFGETCSYGDIAEGIGRPKSGRAVGGAVGDNPVAIVLPCHRVIGTGGALTGFGGGLDRKRWLLGHEAGGLFRSALGTK